MSPPTQSSDYEELAALVQGMTSHLAREQVRGAPRPARASARREAASDHSPALGVPSKTTFEHVLEPMPQADIAVPEPAAAGANRAHASSCADLQELRGLVAACTACPLSASRTQTVFSDGPAQAPVMFVGEAPGQYEDERGVPFVGAAGQLLTDIIQKGMGLKRSEVYIANVLKCRPPHNRDPEPEEKALCTPYLDRQIELVNPRVIVALGRHAAQHLLKTPLAMGRLRGKVHLLNGRKVVATYHPSFLLRTPSAKKDCWQDIQLAMRELGLKVPGKDGDAPGR